MEANRVLKSTVEGSTLTGKALSLSLSFSLSHTRTHAHTNTHAGEHIYLRLLYLDVAGLDPLRLDTLLCAARLSGLTSAPMNRYYPCLMIDEGIDALFSFRTRI